MKSRLISVRTTVQYGTIHYHSILRTINCELQFTMDTILQYERKSGIVGGHVLNACQKYNITIFLCILSISCNCDKANMHQLILHTFIYCIVLSSSFIFQCDASSFKEAHPHTGKVTPFEPGDPKVSLDKKAILILNSGKPYKVSQLEMYLCFIMLISINSNN